MPKLDIIIMMQDPDENYKRRGNSNSSSSPDVLRVDNLTDPASSSSSSEYKNFSLHGHNSNLLLQSSQPSHERTYNKNDA